MRILHTSDWHIGRTFHTHPTSGALREVLLALIDEVRMRDVDVVLIAGDVFDGAVPSADAIDLFETALRLLRETGAQVVLTSGNHDSITRLGMHADWLAASGIHVQTRHERLDVPTTIEDEFGPVQFYGLPYLEPPLLRSAYPDADLRTHEATLRFAMDRVRTDLVHRGGRSVVLAHCFAAGIPAQQESSDVERDIVAGGLGLVPASVFAGVDYVALGHIHGRAVIEEHIRYSGAPLHYSFAESGKPRGGWLVELDARGFAGADWLDLPVPRQLVELHGELDELLRDPRLVADEAHWVKAIATDRVRPIDAMRRLQTRFPNCVAFEWRPTERAAAELGVRSRTDRRSDPEVVAGFLAHVRGGVGPSEFEHRLIDDLLAGARQASA